MEPDLLPLVLTAEPWGFNQQATELGPGTPGLDPCSRDLERRYQAVPAAVCALCCLFGVIYSCFGYRCFKAIMFLSGLLFGSLVIFLLCYKERVLETQLSLEVSAGIALGIGALCGLVTMLVHSVGLFMTGLLLGLLLATAALVAMEPLYQPQSLWVPVGSLLGLALLCALLALRWQKLLTVLSTAVFGAAVIVGCVDYFVELLALLGYVYDRLRLAPSPPLCWHSWAVLALWPALSLLGLLLQWKLTAEGYSHTDVIISRRQKRLQLLRIRQKEAKKRQSLPPQEGSYRRKPNPVKRYAGDVLAPVSGEPPSPPSQKLHPEPAGSPAGHWQRHPHRPRPGLRLRLHRAPDGPCAQRAPLTGAGASLHSTCALGTEAAAMVGGWGDRFAGDT
ncbi:transmembrane protein 198-like isoform X1 [Gopherus evgoodei]|uniref:transmembrane protein 198-like isoform X1 n=1 Tax=Gopherus evgoodei TaxID=1825980 RepID=UPI0011CF50BA|nr:transmembrane protein 198-like isoform X1 [Gopherus evgoodei]